MPIDPAPVPGGNLVLEDNPDPSPFGHPGPVASVVTPGDDERFVSHFATCPNAARHRKDRR
jgi:hypothetical protein